MRRRPTSIRSAHGVPRRGPSCPSRWWWPLSVAIVAACLGWAGSAFGLFSSVAPSQTNRFVAGQIVPATNFLASSVSSSGATLSWTAPTEPAGATITNWTIAQTPAAGSGCGGNEPTNPCTLTGLSPSTAYTWTLTYFVGGWQALTTTTATTTSSGTFSAISSPVNVTNSTNNVVVGFPSGTATGDLVLLVVANNAQQSADFSQGGNSTGWSAVSTASGYPPNQNGNVGQQELQVFWHVVSGATDTSANIRIQTNASGATAWVLDYKGLPSPALNGTTVFGTANNVTTLTPATFTTTSPNAKVISFAAITKAPPAPTAPSLGTANGFTQQVATTAQPNPTNNPWIGLSVADQSVATAGAVTSPVWSEPAASQWVYITAAFT